MLGASLLGLGLFAMGLGAYAKPAHFSQRPTFSEHRDVPSLTPKTDAAVDAAPHDPKCIYSFRGSVENDRRQPISAATIRIRPENDDSIAPTEAHSQADGHFNFDALCTPGPYRLDIEAADFESSTRHISAAAVDAGITISLRSAGTIDVNVVGVDAHAIGRATVTLAGSGVWPARRFETTDDGTVEIKGVPEGVYELRAVFGTLVAEPAEGIELSAGQHVAISLSLAEGVSLDGTVVDAETKAPIENAEVIVNEEALAFEPRVLRTALDGHVLVEGLRHMKHLVSVTAPGYVSIVGMKMMPGGAPISIPLRRAGTVSGVVVDSDGMPIRGALVEVSGTTDTGEPVMLAGGAAAFRTALFAAELRGPDPLRAAGELGVSQNTVPPIPLIPTSADGPSESSFTTGFATDAEGKFEIVGVPPGRISLLVRHYAHAPAVVPAFVIHSAQTLSDFRVVLGDGGTIEGRVVDKRGFGVGLIRVELTSDVESVPRGTLAHEDGTFSFVGVAGDVTLTAYPVGQTPTRADVHVDARATARPTLTLAESATPLHGRVVDEQGYGVAHASVHIRSLHAATPFTAFAETESDGSFDFAGLPPPPFLVDIDEPSFAAFRTTLADAPRDIWTAHLRTAFSITGQIVEEQSREGISGAKIHLASDHDVFEATADESGHFEISRVSTGTYKLYFDADGFVSLATERQLRPGRSNTDALDIGETQLKHAGSASGDVTDFYGVEIPGAEVAIGSPADWAHATRTDLHGHFSLFGLPAGATPITARHPAAGEASAREAIRIRAGEERSLIIIRLPGRFDDSNLSPTSETMETVGSLTLTAAGDKVVVVSMARESDAERAGLRVGDQIVSIDERPTTTIRDVTRGMRGHAGEDALIEVKRDTSTFRFFVPRRH